MTRKTNANAERDPYAQVRSVTAIDGEGISLESGEHLYTLLVSYDSKTGHKRISENWQTGIPTENILAHLVRFLPANPKTLGSGVGHGRINVMYYGNYDVVMWLKDLPNEAKTALWTSGWVVWNGVPGSAFNQSDMSFFIRYIPSKMFFVGLINREDAEDILDDGKIPNIFEWPYHRHHTLIYDVSGFAQQSFVKTLKEWDVEIGAIEHMKKERSNFTASDKRAITDYCVAECKALAQVIQKMDRVFKDEGINLTSWHGGGALAGYFLKHYHAKDYIADPPPGPAMDAVFGAYFGGRAEIFQSGEVGKIHDYDLSSAYPWAITQLPDLKNGLWYHTDKFDWGARFALWRVTWDTRKSEFPNYGPLPYRSKARVYWGSTGQVWAHAIELKEMINIFGPQYFRIHEGWVYAPVDPRARPFRWVRALAEKRVAYKMAGDRRAVPYKYGLNSLYGKLAQRQVDESRQTLYQSYYGAGLITALTRANIARFVFSDGHDDSDVVMIATDGVFCKKASRRYRIGTGLGDFDYKGAHSMLLIQPGVWWTPEENQKRTRGFGKSSVTWNDALKEWRNAGVFGRLDFEETRFVGMGSCAGWGNYTDYGRWVTKNRKILFYPETKWSEGAWNKRARDEGDFDILTPMTNDMSVLSDAYTPKPPQDPESARNYLEQMLALWAIEEQPDVP